MNLAFFPFENKENKYIEITQNTLRLSGAKIVPFEPNFNALITGKIWRNIDAVYLNWYDEINTKSYGKVVKIALQKWLTLHLLRHHKVKIIHTVHNTEQHEASFPLVNLWLKKFVLKQADAVVILSTATHQVIRNLIGTKSYEKRKKSIYLIPHPNYLGAYESSNEYSRIKLGIPDDSFVVLFVGAVRPYKNIELILRLAEEWENRNVRFIIAGKAKSPEYQRSLEAIAADLNNVILMLHFIPDEEIISLLSVCDLMLLPYNLRSSLNSSSAMMAFSCKKTAIIPNIGTIQDIPLQKYYFAYTYDNENEHFEKMKKQAERAYQEFLKNPDDLRQCGTYIYDYVKENNSVETNAERYHQMFQDIFQLE